MKQQIAAMGRNATPTMLTKRRSATTIRIRVLLLDDQYQTFYVDSKCNGEELFRLVCDELDLLERDFFGLRYQDTTKQLFWVDASELVKKQLKATTEADCFLCAKYYVADPCSLREELTRYYFFLQVKRDVLQGRIMVTPALAAGLFACILQSELGDYSDEDLEPGYVGQFQFLPEQGQSADLEEEAEEVHKSLRGMVPCDAEKRFLDKAKWLPLYGVDLHPVKGASGTALQIGINQSGISVFLEATRVSFFHWPKISKVQFRRKMFIVHVVISNEGAKLEVLKYKFVAASEKSAKELWKCGVEQHCFFRRIVINPNMDFSRGGGGLLRSGSKFRYTGRTEFQVRQSMRAVSRNEPQFTRVDSRFCRKSLPPALQMSAVDHHWRSQRGLTINDNPHNKALKQASKKTAPESHESLYSRLARPLKRVTVAGHSLHRKSSTVKAASESDGSRTNSSNTAAVTGAHSPAHRAVSAPSLWLWGRTRKSREANSGDSVQATAMPPSSCSNGKHGSTEQRSDQPNITISQQQHQQQHAGQQHTNQSTESSQRFTMPWIDLSGMSKAAAAAAAAAAEAEAEADANAAEAGDRPDGDQGKFHDAGCCGISGGAKVSQLYADHRRRCIYNQSSPPPHAHHHHQHYQRVGSADDILAAGPSPQLDYAVPRPSHEAPPFCRVAGDDDFQPRAPRLHSNHVSDLHRRSPGALSAGALGRVDAGALQVGEDSLSLTAGRARLRSSGSGATDWPWLRTDTPTGESGLDGQLPEADYLLEESVSDEAHKLYMQKLWEDMTMADTPPPTDLAIRPKVVTRHLTASARKARRTGAKSAVLTGTAAEKVGGAAGAGAAAGAPAAAAGAAVNPRHSSGETSTRASHANSLDRQAFLSNLVQAGYSDTLPAIARRSPANAEKKRNALARDRRASVLGVQLFTSQAPTLPPTSEVEAATSTTYGGGAGAGGGKALSDDGGRTSGPGVRAARLRLEREESDDVLETSGTFEMISPLQRRMSDLNAASVAQPREHEQLKTKRSLPTRLPKGSSHDEDEEEEDEADFGYLPGDEVPPRQRTQAIIKVKSHDLPVIAHLKEMDVDSCKPAHGRVTSFGSAISDDVFATDPAVVVIDNANNPAGRHIPAAGRLHGAEPYSRSADPNWFKSS